MSVTNQLSSIMHNDRTVPLDLRYTDFLNALSDIHDENMRDRCHKYWTSLYRYFDRSMTNERALILEEKRTHEILHRLDIEMSSRQSDIAYQVQNILKRGHQVLADLHIKYNRKTNSLKEIKQNIDNLANRIQKHNSEHSLITDFNTVSSSISLHQITGTIDNLKLEIKNLQITREIFQREFNIKRSNYFSTKIKTYHIQQTIHKTEQQLMEIEHELTNNLKEIHEQNNQLNQFRQNISISINPESSTIDHQSITKQLNNEQKLSFELKEQNNELNKNLSYYLTILKTNKNNQIELNINTKNLIELIRIKQEHIKNENEIKQNLSQILTNLKLNLKRKQKILFTNHRQQTQLKNQIIELEHKRDTYHQQSENIKLSTNNIKQTIHQEANHRLKLTIIHHNLKHQIITLENTTQEYILLVKEQRQKVINYEKLHDKWILNININRNRLVELFHRINIIEQCIINTKDFLQQFDHIKLSLRPNILILYSKMNLFIQQRREKNDDEGKNFLNIKFSQIKKVLQSNETIFYQIKQNISFLNKNSSILSNQISTINKQRFHLIQYLEYLQNKYLIKQQQIRNISKIFNQRKYIIHQNNQKFQRLTLEKPNIIIWLLNKQHLILFISKHIQLNEKILIKHRSSYHRLMNKIQQIRNQVLRQIQQNKLFDKQHQPNMKQLILHLRKELLEYKKKTNDFQYRIHRQIFTKFNNKSIIKGITTATY